MAALDMNALVGDVDIVFMTLDTLRFDVADAAHREGRTPHLSALIGTQGWERRHAPGSFTYASHAAFFAGFLPTPVTPGLHERLFALAFEGSATTGPGTKVLEGASIIEGLATLGYRTVCIGGTGFFNKQTPLGRVFPEYFHESHWTPALGVTDPRSTDHQVSLARRCLDETPDDAPLFLFINVSALHQPTHFYLPGADGESVESHAAALEYVDGALAPLLGAFRRRTLVIVCSDHGTAYGEDGHYGHRIGVPTVWEVPYAQVLCEGSDSTS